MTHKLVYPHALPFKGPRPDAANLHQTSGLAGNWALDFIAPGGTTIICWHAGTVFRFSGHDPSEGVIGSSVYGFSTYIHTHGGLIYYLTHQDRRYVQVGDRVVPGQRLGRVGHWPHDEGRSHSHIGVTHWRGEQFAKALICRVAESPRVHVTP